MYCFKCEAFHHYRYTITGSFSHDCFFFLLFKSKKFYETRLQIKKENINTIFIAFVSKSVWRCFLMWLPWHCALYHPPPNAALRRCTGMSIRTWLRNSLPTRFHQISHQTLKSHQVFKLSIVFSLCALIVCVISLPLVGSS